MPEPYVDNPSRVSFALRSAVEDTYDVIHLIVVGIVRIAEGKVSISTLGGPITVYDVVGEEGKKGVSYFVWAMAVISINLGLVNLLPIPVLDGGHLMYYTVELLRGRPVSERTLAWGQRIGLAALAALMAFALFNDIQRLVTG